ncbi:MAG: DMT family transporter [Desulfurellaceae bacterium]|nr:DMT family transporter [Desulfurellaceae bacterium]
MINAPFKAVCYMLATIALLSVSDAAAKWLVPHYPAVQIVFLRALLGVGPALVLVVWEQGRRGLATSYLFAHTVRSVLMLVSWLLFIVALRSISLANAYTLVFGAPLFMTLFGRIFLGERVSRSRWVAVIGGFVGVLIVLSPASLGFSFAALIALLAAVVWAVTSLVARRLSQHEPSTRILFYYMAISAVATLPFAAAGWTPIALGHVPLFLLTGLIGVAAHWLLAQAFRYGEVSLIAPFEYTGLVWAMALGYWLWGDVPSSGVLAGGALIIASGIYMVRHEGGSGRTEEEQDEEQDEEPTPSPSPVSSASSASSS